MYKYTHTVPQQLPLASYTYTRAPRNDEKALVFPSSSNRIYGLLRLGETWPRRCARWSPIGVGAGSFCRENASSSSSSSSTTAGARCQTSAHVRTFSSSIVNSITDRNVQKPLLLLLLPAHGDIMVHYAMTRAGWLVHS